MTDVQATAQEQRRILDFPPRKPQPLAQEAADPDWVLVCRARRGDMAAFESIVRKYNRRLFLIARGVLHDDDDAEDAVQETYLKAYLKMDQFVGPAGFSAWLARVALNEALQRLRRQSPTVAWPEDDDTAAASDIASRSQIADAPYAERHISLKELRGRLTDAIGTLPPGFRAVLLLRGVEGLSVESTAQCLGIPAATVKTRYLRAKDRLRREIGGEIDPLLPLTFTFAGQRCDRIVRLVGLRLRALAYRLR
jgi:RNA polymerase sigma-70 factor (ECF subfamily)